MAYDKLYIYQRSLVNVNFNRKFDPYLYKLKLEKDKILRPPYYIVLLLDIFVNNSNAKSK